METNMRASHLGCPSCNLSSEAKLCTQCEIQHDSASALLRPWREIQQNGRAGVARVQCHSLTAVYRKRKLKWPLFLGALPAWQSQSMRSERTDPCRFLAQPAQGHEKVKGRGVGWKLGDSRQIVRRDQPARFTHRTHGRARFL